MYVSTGSGTIDCGGWEQIWEHISGRGVAAARAPGNRSLNVKAKEPKCWILSQLADGMIAIDCIADTFFPNLIFPSAIFLPF